MIRRIFVDCETTGLDPGKHQMLTLGVAIYDGKENVFSKEWKIKRNFESEISEEAMKINGIDLVKHDFHAKQDVEVIDEFIETAKFWSGKNSKIKLYGHNVGFDIGFIRAMFNKYSEQNKYNYILYPFHYHYGDSMILANTLKEIGLLVSKGVGLPCLMKLYQINYNAHNALEDAKASAQIYFKLIDLIKGVNPNVRESVKKETKGKKDKDLNYDPLNIACA